MKYLISRNGHKWSPSKTGYYDRILKAGVAEVGIADKEVGGAVETAP